MLFAQGALALAACGWAQREPARVVAGMDDMGCCTEGAIARDLSENANLCLAHCTGDAQRVEAFGSPPLPMLSASAVLVVALPLQVGRNDLSRGRPLAYGFAAPPLVILFQNFRI